MINNNQTDTKHLDRVAKTIKNTVLAAAHLSSAAEADTKQSIGSASENSEDKWAMVSPALLVALKLGHEEGEKVNVLCACSAIHMNGIRLTLPCHLNMMPDDILNMEIFLPSTSQPIPVTTIISAIRASNSEDSIFYEVDAEFRQLSSSVKNDIRAFQSDNANFKRKMLSVV